MRSVMTTFAHGVPLDERNMFELFVECSSAVRDSDRRFDLKMSARPVQLCACMRILNAQSWAICVKYISPIMNWRSKVTKPASAFSRFELRDSDAM